MLRHTALRLHYSREVFGQYGAIFNRVTYNTKKLLALLYNILLNYSFVRNMVILTSAFTGIITGR